MTASQENAPASIAAVAKPPKLHGRAFYESIGCPKSIVAPMVDQSEFIWRMLSRSFLPEERRSSLLAYTPMFHARLFVESQKYRETHFQAMRGDKPWLDGNPAIDRPLFVQFCANDPAHLLSAAKLVEPYCDAVDLNLGCPQGIAKKGHYGSFLQEDQELIHNLIKTLHEGLSIPVTAKIRILETREKTLAYAKNVLSAGASILTVHGRRREQKGHITGLADWDVIRYLRENLPAETVLFANGNILQHGDIEKCLAATGADGIMSAEGNLSNPGIFAIPPTPEEAGPEFWRGKDGKGGWRVDAVFRRYLDLIHQYVKDAKPPQRRPLFVPGHDTAWMDGPLPFPEQQQKREEGPKKKKVKVGSDDRTNAQSPNYVAMQPHLFHLLRHFVTVHTDVRDALAKSRLGDISLYENILEMVERKVAKGLIDYEATQGESIAPYLEATAHVKHSNVKVEGEEKPDPMEEDIEDKESSVRTVRECKRPWWVVQPIVRPLPKEALAKGAIMLKKQKQDKTNGAGNNATNGHAQPRQKNGQENGNGAGKANGISTVTGSIIGDPQSAEAALGSLKRKASEI
ncbi:dihydrouridine synthase [Rhypophila decipiens]|uniref:tRNA-dihydrouridine(16/17) synthase [NAD(P)(+)] n=1 Tax=Rhypophila decipiens TaxID=261697 RepID=A0AAN6YEP4_9PEZI|nr:dihydrouridine synthase [Rhypophila decipiens]